MWIVFAFLRFYYIYLCQFIMWVQRQTVRHTHIHPHTHPHTAFTPLWQLTWERPFQSGETREWSEENVHYSRWCDNSFSSESLQSLRGDVVIKGRLPWAAAGKIPPWRVQTLESRLCWQWWWHMTLLRLESSVGGHPKQQHDWIKVRESTIFKKTASTSRQANSANCLLSVIIM